MKNTVFISLLFLAAMGGCRHKSANNFPGTPGTGVIYKGVVQISMCGQIAVETFAPNYLGEDTWTAGTYAGAPVYHHIFSVQNACQFNRSKGDTITFRIVGSQAQTCAVCMAYVPTPSTKYPIEVID